MLSTATRPRVLFLCTGNACRSQMAEGWARALHGDSIDVCSAGTNPHGLNMLAVRVMGEVGIDISHHASKTIEACDPSSVDFVVTVCQSAAESCPVWQGHAVVVHHGFDDPPRLAKEAGAADDESAMTHYRRVRDEIRLFVETLPEVLERAGTRVG